MDEYISREVVFDEIQFQREFAESNGESSVVDTCDAMLHNLRKIETADVQPVKHGRWIVTKTERGWNCAEYPVEWTCSECNVANDRKDDFCPHCGSYNRMGGDSE